MLRKTATANLRKIKPSLREFEALLAQSEKVNV
jgi:hypothetical protein